jgi:cytochrome c-type biogenesis protein CcmF
MLAMIAFSMSMIGTFLVRSGVLTSVHAFAVDPERGTFILALLAFYIGAAFTLFALRSGKLSEGPRFELVSREAALVGNNLFLTVILGIVFIGTLYPLFIEALTGDKLSVGAPYFNAVAGPLALLLALLVCVGPLLNWRRDSGEKLKRLIGPALVGVTVLAIAIVTMPGSLLSKAGLGIAAMLAISAFLPLVGRKLRRTPLSTWGMVVAHFGIAVALAGMAASTMLTKEVLTAARPGEQVQVGPWLVEFKSVAPTAGPNWTALEAELRASRGSGVTVLKPQARYYTSPPTETTESAIKTVLSGQLYTVLGKPAEDGRWQLRLWWKPLVTLIWLGGALIALGGALSLGGRAWRGLRKGRER